jgi:pseudaminic acid synthase
MSSEIKISGSVLGAGHPPFVIAELSGNHNGDITRALRLIDAAKAAGADAVKLQTYRADTITINHDGPGFTLDGGPWNGRRLYDLYQEAHTPWDWHPVLFNHARDLGLICFSSPFDYSAVDFLEKLDVPAYKVASFEINDIPLINYIARTNKPIIISTGMASLNEIRDATEAANQSMGKCALLHCVSGYPTPVEEANLARIPVLAKTFGRPVGLSDHTLGIDVATASIALGAAIVEKHITLARADGGPDAEFSLEPHEFAALVKGVRSVFSAIGSPAFRVAESEKLNMKLRRSIYAVADIAQGEEFTGSNVRSIRPGFGLAPASLPKILGKRASRQISRGTPLSWDDIEG